MLISLARFSFLARSGWLWGDVCGRLGERAFYGWGKPFPWQGGIKTFSDRVYLLRTPQGPWRELDSRLPFPLAHSACTPYQNGVLSVGGVNASGPLRDVCHIVVENAAVRWRALPALPHPIVYGAAAVVSDVLYVVGGVAEARSTDPLSTCWALSLREGSRWTAQPDIPGRAGSVITVGADGERLYAFGGMAFLPGSDGTIRPDPLDAAYCYDPGIRTWAPLPSLPEARAGAASPSARLPDGRFLVCGGYRFVFPGPPQDHPGFERTTWLYSPEKKEWDEGPPFPYCRAGSSISEAPKDTYKTPFLPKTSSVTV